MYQHQNKSVLLSGSNGGKYEIFWTCANAEHIVKKESHPSHQITIKQIEDFALSAIFIEHPQATTPPKHLGLGKHNGKYYQVVCYFVKRKAYRRCIIETCCVVSDDTIRKICRLLSV